MRVVVVGTRGIPHIQGGVETHCEQLYPRLVELGCEVTVIRRSCYTRDERPRLSEYRGVRLIDVYAPRKKSLEAFAHTTLAIIKALGLHPDVVHFHAVGPSVVIPLARLLGMTVVATNHGPDYERDKWNALARAVIRAGEWCQARMAREVIAISRPIVDTLAQRYHRTRGVHLIHNGVETPPATAGTDFLDSLGLTPQRYVLALGRFVPEKRFDWLVRAFAACRHDGYRLVLAGDADHEDTYSLHLKALAREHDVTLTGFITGEPLQQLLHHAALLVLPSSHEGLPIALLEAMSHGRDVLVSDIAANRLAQLHEGDFFNNASLDDLTAQLQRKLLHPTPRRAYDLAPYDWDHIARQTLEVYRHAVDKR